MERSTWLSAAKCTMARGRCSREDGGDKLRIADISMRELVARVRFESEKICRIAGVGEQIEIDNGSADVLDPSQHEVGTDEPGAAGNEDGVAASCHLRRHPLFGIVRKAVARRLLAYQIQVGGRTRNALIASAASLSYFTGLRSAASVLRCGLGLAGSRYQSMHRFRCKSGQKHAVSIAEKTIAGLYRMAIGSQNAFPPCEGTDQHQEARLREMKIGEQRAGNLKFNPGEMKISVSPE